MLPALSVIRIAVFTISTRWLVPAAATSSGGWQLQLVSFELKPTKLAPSVTLGTVRSSSSSTLGRIPFLGLNKIGDFLERRKNFICNTSPGKVQNGEQKG